MRASTLAMKVQKQWLWRWSIHDILGEERHPSVSSNLARKTQKQCSLGSFHGVLFAKERVFTSAPPRIAPRSAIALLGKFLEFHQNSWFAFQMVVIHSPEELSSRIVSRSLAEWTTREGSMWVRGARGDRRVCHHKKPHECLSLSLSSLGSHHQKAT